MTTAMDPKKAMGGLTPGSSGSAGRSMPGNSHAPAPGGAPVHVFEGDSPGPGDRFVSNQLAGQNDHYEQRGGQAARNAVPLTADAPAWVQCASPRMGGTQEASRTSQREVASRPVHLQAAHRVADHVNSVAELFGIGEWWIGLSPAERNQKNACLARTKTPAQQAALLRDWASAAIERQRGLLDAERAAGRFAPPSDGASLPLPIRLQERIDLLPPRARRLIALRLHEPQTVAEVRNLLARADQMTTRALEHAFIAVIFPRGDSIGEMQRYQMMLEADYVARRERPKPVSRLSFAGYLRLLEDRVQKLAAQERADAARAVERANGLRVPPSKVVVRTTAMPDDSDRFRVLDQVLAESGFWSSIDARWRESDQLKSDFLVAVKPNVMMFYSKDDMSVITEPAMVEYLIDRLVSKGYTNIALVESQNVYSNWFNNRTVENVAREAGYRPVNYRIVDLTREAVPHEYPKPLGRHFVGRTWRDADYRISFAKNKTHSSCKCTLTIKNIFGTTPSQNKFREYHEKREIEAVTVAMLEEFPVHFGIVDAVWSADGAMGFKTDPTPKHTKTLYAGADLAAVDIVGARKMGIDPADNPFITHAVERLGMPNFVAEGDLSVYPDWDNVPRGLALVGDAVEEMRTPAALMGLWTSDMSAAFPMKPQSSWKKVIRPWALDLLRLVGHWE